MPRVQFPIADAYGEMYLAPFVTQREREIVLACSQHPPELDLKSLEKRFLFPSYIERDKSLISNAIYFACQKVARTRNLFGRAVEETIIAGQPVSFLAENMNGLNARDPVTAIGGTRS